jgi:nucleoside-diphosphate-sugar epimerase
MARVLVFGAGGYIGIPLCEALESRGHWVQAVDRFFFGKYPKVFPPLLHADIRDYECGEGLFDTVIDLAGLSNDATADIDPELTVDINKRGALHLALTAKHAGVRKYIYASSCSVYGSGQHARLTETDACKPLTLYAECKVRVEDHLRGLASPDFRPIILRNATVFGVAPRMRFDLAINIMTKRALQGHIIYVMGGGKQLRPFVHVSDVVDAFVTAVESMNEADTFNVGSNEGNASIEQIATMVSQQCDGAALHRIPDDPDKRSYHVSFDKIALAGFKPKVGIRAGIAEVRQALINGSVCDDDTCHTLNWYRKLIEWDRRLTALRLNGRLL